jgi:hypothetical protein
MISEGQLNRPFTKPASPFFIIGPAADASGIAFVLANEIAVGVRAEMGIIVVEISRSQIGIDANNPTLTTFLAGLVEKLYIGIGRKCLEDFLDLTFDVGIHLESSCCEGTNLVRRSA